MEVRAAFDYFYEDFKEHGFKVLNATYVTSDSGTGLVHQAPAFGEEDYNVAMDAESSRRRGLRQTRLMSLVFLLAKLEISLGFTLRYFF